MKILNWRTGEVIFEDSFSTMRETVENAVRQKISLECVWLHRENLIDVDLSYVNLKYANLYDANLTNTNLEGADLTNTDLYGTNLREAKLRDIDLEKLYINLNKDIDNFDYIKDEILNHPNCPLTFKICNLLS